MNSQFHFVCSAFVADYCFLPVLFPVSSPHHTITTSYHYNVSLFIFVLFLLVVYEGNGRTFWKCEEEEMFTPREGKKVWQSEVSEKLVCRKHQVLLCDVVLCECMTCISGLHQGVRCCFTIYTAITGWRGAPSTPASHRVFCRFFYFKFEAEHFLLHHKLWRGTSEKLKDRYSV